MKPKRVDILGVPVDCVTMDQALAAVEAMLGGNTPEMVIAVNPEKVMKAQRDDVLLERLRRAGLLLPDGIGVVLAARILGLGRLERVPGSELMPRICERAARYGHKIFLFGGGQDVTARAALVLRMCFPRIQIVGTQHGYLKEEEMPALIQRINDSGAKVLFIALGSPRQEIWMDRYLPQLNVKVCQGVGGTFDVLAGRKKRAPLYFRKLHLEWFYRLVSEPSRALRQTALLQFTGQVLRKMVIG